ncbi:MAG: AsmA-like C-terminal region-containing protein [Bacteroidales bacterium]
MVKKIRNYVEYLAAFLIIFALILVIASVVIVKFYGDELQDYTLNLVNEQLDTKLTVEEVGFSVLRKFPYTSVFFNNVIVWSGHNFDREEFKSVSPDTLFTADRLYMQFNLMDLIRKKYTIKSLEARNGVMRILIDQRGNGNFMIDRKDPKDSKERFIDMKGVAVRNFHIHYMNLAKEIEARALIQEMHLEGNFANRNYTLKAGGDAFIHEFMNHGVTYLSKQSLHSDISLEVANNSFTISKGALTLGELAARITGAFLLDKEVGTDLNLRISGSRIDIEWISEILAKSKISPEGIKGKGVFNLEVDVTGLLTPTRTPQINAKFYTRNASLDLKNPLLVIRNLSLEGNYSNGVLLNIRSTILQLESVSCRVGNSSISGSVRLENLLAPKFRGTLSGDLASEDLSPYLEKFPVKIGHGRVKPDLKFSGSISGRNQSGRKVQIVPEGTVLFSDLHIATTKFDLLANNVNGNLVIGPNNWKTALSGLLRETDFKTEITFNNPLNMKSGSTPLDIEGTIYSRNVDVDQLIMDLKKESDREVETKYPENIRLNLQFRFDQITKGDIQTKQVSGTLIYRYPALYIDPIYLETMNGVINSRIALMDLHKPQHQLSMNSSFRNVEIRDLFRSFNNFKQDFLTHENIAGSISGDSEFLSAINPDFSISPADIISENSFVIKNGELINFKPMIEMSKLLKIDKMDAIKFSTISNTILINDNKITIPEMDINSTALNIQASGTHGFDKTYKYHLATKLSELLFSKAQSTPNKEFNIALDKDDKRTVFLILFDEGDGMVIEFDEYQALKKIRQDLKDERTALKKVLNEEFGLFRDDKDLKKQIETTKEPVLKFDFSGENPEDTVQSETEEKRRWWQRRKDTVINSELKFIMDEDDK